MARRISRNWLPWQSNKLSRKSRRRGRTTRRLLGLDYSIAASFEPLEARQLLTASPTTAPLVSTFAQVVGREIFYNNSVFDGNNPSATAADDRAVATDKRALLPGQSASLANYTSYRGGINGIMIDVAGLIRSPGADDFLFRVGNNDDPATWIAAPAPSSITVRDGAGVGGSSRITILWPDDAIKRTWLQVIVPPTADTGLKTADIFYFGNAIGESGNSATDANVTSADQVATRSSPYGLSNSAPITATADYNRDGLVNATDERIARSNATSLASRLRLIRPRAITPPTEIFGRYIFYNNSEFDGNNPPADAQDDQAIAPGKTALRSGQRATFANYTSYDRGINGIMIDVAGLTQTLSADDFEFRTGNNNQPANWTAAPQPSGITIREGAGVSGSARVTLTWPDSSIKRQWLQVTVKANSHTGLTADDVFYFGNAIGESGDSPVDAMVNSVDLVRARTAAMTSGGALAPLAAPCDFNRDEVVNSTDQSIALQNSTALGGSLNLINLTAPAASTATQGQPAFTDFVTAQVLARKIFYNNSRFDGDDIALNLADNGAIAVGKTALLPGGTASFANYTSYSRGIDGIMIDVLGLPDSVTAGDFEFRVGTNADPTQWTVAPAPASITTRFGAGTLGSTRISIAWPDNAIQQTWLQVTLKATVRTGLVQSDVFYFGNVIGESGNSTTDTMVNSADEIAARNAAGTLSQQAPITARCDYNRDGIIDQSDELVARNSDPGPFSLPLLTAPANVQQPSVQGMIPGLFNPGDGGFNVVFGPVLVKTKAGSLLALAEGRWARNDTTSYAIIMRRSTDNGVTWSSVSVVYSIGAYSYSHWVNGAATVVDEVTGQIFVVFVKDTSSVWVTSSTDDGLTWSLPNEITNSVKVTADGNPNPGAYPSTPWGWYATTHGLQIRTGPYAGRLVIAADHRFTGDVQGTSWTHVIYSDDHGATWHLGGGLAQDDPVNENSNEAALAETSDGRLYMNIRVKGNTLYRGYSYSSDGGMTWTPMALAPQLISAHVSGSLLRVNASTVLYAGPDNWDDGTRHQMTIWISTDNMNTWTKTKAVFYGYAGYSAMVLAGNDTVLVAFGAGQAGGTSLSYIALVRFNLRYLLSAAPPQFSWYFNEQAPGVAANIHDPSIRDSSPFDVRGLANADTPQEAPRYVPGANNNDAALRLTTGSDVVQLTPSSINALQFFLLDSITVEMVVRTTAPSGVFIGSRPNIRNWVLQLFNGQLQFSLNDLSSVTTITSSAPINDGQWHHIAVVRDAVAGTLSMYVDRVPAADPVVDRSGVVKNYDPITLGAYNDGTGQLAFDVDALRVTRAALGPGKFLSPTFVAPPPPQPPTYPSDAPNMISGLELWLPAYDATHYFAGMGFAGPVAPIIGNAVNSAYDASANRFEVSTSGDTRELLYAYDPLVGPNWLNAALSRDAGNNWIVHNSNGTQADNFDFVQNTGKFTLSTFVKLGTNVGGSYMTLFDTTESTTTNPGFTLSVLEYVDVVHGSKVGSLSLQITGSDGLIRFNGETAAGLVSSGSWYHVAVVGNGAGAPIRFYITPVDQSTVQPFTSSAVIGGPDGNYATDIEHDLTIGARAKIGLSPFNGNMVDQTIYNRALSAAEIQQLFDYTKKT